MRDEYDFSKATKNPFAGKIKNKYTVLVTYDFTKDEHSGSAELMTIKAERDAQEELLTK